MDHAETMGVVRTARRCRICHDANRRIDAGCIGGMGCGKHLRTLGVHGNDANCARGWNRDRSYRANGYSPSGDIPHGGSLVIKQKVRNVY